MYRIKNVLNLREKKPDGCFLLTELEKLGYFPINDKQTTLKKSRFHFFIEIYAQCSETNEKSIL